MKKKIIIGLVVFVAVIGVAQIIGGESAAMVVLYSFSGLITFALFDFLIYKIVTWGMRQSKGKRIFSYVIGGYLGIALIIVPFVPLLESCDIAVTVALAIIDFVLLGILIYKIRKDGEWRERQIEEQYKPTSPVSIDEMDGHTFEHFCADILRSNGFTHVSVTPASGDQGVDVLAEKGGLKFAVQCKKWSYPIGNTAVQEVSAGKAFYKCDVAVVLTNSTFTKGAIELAEATGVLIWDGDKLDELIHSAAAPDEERQKRSGTVLGKSEYEFTCNRCGHTWYMTGGEIRSAKVAKRSVRVMKIQRFGRVGPRKLNDLSTRIAITEPAASYDKCPACGSHSITKSKA